MYPFNFTDATRMTPMTARIPESESILIRGILEVNRRMTQTPQIPPISTPQSPTGNPARKPLSLPSGTTTLLPVRAGAAREHQIVDVVNKHKRDVRFMLRAVLR